jgi:hypothetical protein
MSDDEEPDADNGGDGGDMADFLDHFATAIIALRDLALNAKIKPAQIKKLARLERRVADSQAKLGVVEVQARELVARAERDVAAIRDDAQRRLDAAATAEQELEQREQKIARLESAWRFIGEPADVMSGFRAAEYSPLQKARMAHGQPPGKDPDRLLFSEPDTAPAMRIDALSDTHDDPHADRQGAPFLGELTRDVSHHKRRGAT